MWQKRRYWMNEIRNIWHFFENLNECVYVADIETHEIVYMNKKMLSLYGLTDVEDIKRKKCYEVLQNTSIPCGMCNNEQLTAGHFIEWFYFNPVVEKYYMLKDTLLEDDKTGRKYRIEIALDMSLEKEHDKRVQKYQSMEKIVNEGLRIALSANTSEESIPIILEYLGKKLNGERTYIFEKNEAGGDDNTYEWVAESVSSEKDRLQDLPQEVCADWYHNFQKGEIVLFQNIEEVRHVNPRQYEILKSQNIYSLAIVPLFDEERVIGFYGIDNPPMAALKYASNMLQITAHFIVSCIRRRNLTRKLVEMSYKDALTNLGNRFAMDDYIANTNREKSLGVVYCDITGLKQVNDTMGHEAGDRLILRACECLKKAFGEYGIFRIGGDEMLVLCSGIDEEEQKERISSLREYMEERDVNIAIGAMWLKKVENDLDELLKESERLMYEEKAAYYARAGIERRK